MVSDEPRQEDIKRLLDYDPDTGLFRWRETTYRKHTVAGAVAGGLCSQGYVRIRLFGKKRRASRLAWIYVHGDKPTGIIDHINGDRADNRISNLRDVCERENLQNLRRARKNNRLGVLGVVAVNGRFEAAIKTGGKTTRLGRFDTPDEAHAAYVDKKRQLHKGCTL